MVYFEVAFVAIYLVYEYPFPPLPDLGPLEDLGILEDLAPPFPDLGPLEDLGILEDPFPPLPDLPDLPDLAEYKALVLMYFFSLSMFSICVRDSSLLDIAFEDIDGSATAIKGEHSAKKRVRYFRQIIFCLFVVVVVVVVECDVFVSIEKFYDQMR